MITYVATGHRPPRLKLDYDSASNKKLTDFAFNYIKDGNCQVISGMAQGWDQAVAHAAILCGYKLFCYLPFKDIGDNWPTSAKKRRDAILNKATEVHYLYDNYEKGKNKSYIERDCLMVNRAMTFYHSFLLALWDGKFKGGTYHTIKYADDLKLKCINLWEDWHGVLKTDK